MKQLLGLVAVAALLCFVGLHYFQSRSSDFWGYGKLGLTDGRPGSPIYFIEVRGVGDLPTVARIVRCEDRSCAPRNLLDVSHGVSAYFDERTRVVDRWRSDCLLLVGRGVEEVIEIPLDPATAQRWFNEPNPPIGDFARCQKFWDEFVAPRLP